MPWLALASWLTLAETDASKTVIVTNQDKKHNIRHKSYSLNSTRIQQKSTGGNRAITEGVYMRTQTTSPSSSQIHNPNTTLMHLELLAQIIEQVFEFGVKSYAA
ncbi:hypothetical protein PNOK_0594100 [Pyrrhoderma noxium]|uniref:Secreted protein n=1 Tax=Pyrrhoderma noxium TaxID=2282107 RepID=A0A286UHN0_9AGAM|nr:hypothetical protein PNOK_0594100 [Pyrrhoderma noxium]